MEIFFLLDVAIAWLTFLQFAKIIKRYQVANQFFNTSQFQKLQKATLRSIITFYFLIICLIADSAFILFHFKAELKSLLCL